jgi:hypothetical protein
VNLAQLQQELRAQRVTVSPSPAGGLRYDAPAPIPAQLVEALKEHKAALLRDPLVIGAQVGHCGSCRRWSPGPWVPYMGECSAGWPAHGLTYGAPPGPVEIQAGHSCAAYGGKGWQARSTA